MFTKKFDEGTSRIWITTYLDNDMRIVWAGPTESEAKQMGSSADVSDHFVFVMTRESVTRTMLGNIVKDKKVISVYDDLADPAKFMDDE